MIQTSTLLNVLHVPADDSKYTMKAALPGVIGCVKRAQTFNALEKNGSSCRKKKGEEEKPKWDNVFTKKTCKFPKHYFGDR